MATVIFHVTASILLLIVLPGRAQTQAEETQSATISDARMRSILSGMAFDFTEDSRGDATAFAIHLDGHPFTLLNQTKGLSLSACFGVGVDLMKGNQWNREHFSTRAYIDDQGCTSLASDVSFGGGPTDQTIRDFIREFCTDLAVFARFLTDSPAVPDAPSAAPIGAMAWSQIGPYAKRVPPWPGVTESAPGLLKFDSKTSLKYDPAQWMPTAPHVDGQFAFSHASGGGHALVIAEHTEAPIDSVEDIALANAQSVDPHARIVFRNRTWVKGTAFWFLKLEATVGTVPMVYWGYFYAGAGFTVQVVTYTEKSHLPEYEHAFTDFLNGLTISR